MQLANGVDDRLESSRRRFAQEMLELGEGRCHVWMYIDPRPIATEFGRLSFMVKMLTYIRLPYGT